MCFLFGNTPCYEHHSGNGRNNRQLHFLTIFGCMAKSTHLHFKMYKPYGVLSQLASNDPRDIRKKIFLSAGFTFPEGIMPVGRLDEKSEGLLLLTSNGKLSDRINRAGVEKEYIVQLDGEITDAALQCLAAGVEIGFSGRRYVTKPCKAEKLDLVPHFPPPDPRIRIGRHRPGSWVRIVVTEGKFRQVRKMTAAVGYPTLRLIRVRIGTLYLGDLQPGEVQPLILAGVPATGLSF